MRRVVEKRVSGGKGRFAGPASEHLGKLVSPGATAIQWLDLRDRPAVALVFLDAQVVVGVGGDLRKVGNADDLVVASQAPQEVADRVRRPAADASVDFV